MPNCAMPTYAYTHIKLKLCRYAAHGVDGVALCIHMNLFGDSD